MSEYEKYAKELKTKPTMSRADRACAFISRLTLCDEFAGQPMVLHPFQEDIVRGLYRTDQDGKTIVRKCLLLVPRKTSGKTQLAACLALEHIFQKDKTGLLCLCAATDRHTAGHLFKKVRTIIEADPYLSSQCRIYTGTKRIETKTGNVLQVKSSEGKRAHGENPSMVILDECHTFINSDLVEGLTTGFGARTEHLTLMLSTQGNRRDTFLYKEYEYACQVRDGIIDDPEYLPVIYELPMTDENGNENDFTDEANWHRAMPGLKHFGNIESIRSDLKQALAIPSKESSFRQYHLNQLVASSNKWVHRAKWAKCGETKFTKEDLKGREVFVGIDLSNTSDITAMVLVAPWEDGSVKVLPYFFIPRNYANMRDRKGHTQYGPWSKHEGCNLEFTGGDEIDYPYLEKRIPEILEDFKVRVINVDPYNATSTTQRLQSMGLPVFKHRCGWQSVNGPMKHIEVMISKGLLHHCNNPVLNWMAMNSVANRDKADNLTLDKEHSSDKVDGVMGMILAISGMISCQGRINVYSKKSEITVI